MQSSQSQSLRPLGFQHFESVLSGRVCRHGIVGSEYEYDDDLG